MQVTTQRHFENVCNSGKTKVVDYAIAVINASLIETALAVHASGKSKPTSFTKVIEGEFDDTAVTALYTQLTLAGWSDVVVTLPDHRKAIQVEFNTKGNNYS